MSHSMAFLLLVRLLFGPALSDLAGHAGFGDETRAVALTGRARLRRGSVVDLTLALWRSSGTYPKVTTVSG